MLAIVHATRNHPEVALGVSTRGALVFFTACQALALVSGRDFVVPDDVKRLATPVLSHRVVLHDRRVLRGDFAPETRLIEKIVSEVPVPR
jgi:MoxR-like ATPase